MLRPAINPLDQSPARNLLFGTAFVVVVGLLAMLGYIAYGWSLGDAFYMVVTTVFTVGYGEVHPVNSTGLRAITVALIVAGCSGMLFVTGAIFQFITLAQVQQIFGARRMTRQMEELRNHVVVCGFGRLGRMLARELRAARSDFVIIERNQDVVAEARGMGMLCLHADASDEGALEQAGVARARALASVVEADAVNVFITLSARALNPDLQIVARGESPATERKLLQAGANNVVMPAHIGAEQVASLILFPALSDLIADTDRRRQMELDMRTLGLEIEVVVAADGSPYVGLTVAEIEQRSGGTFFILAIEHAGQKAAIRARPDMRIEAGDGVTLLGRGGRAGSVALFG